MNFGDIQGTTLNGSLVFCSMTHFNSGGADYYLLDSDTTPQDFATVTATSNGGNVGAFAYLNKSMSLDQGALLNGRALVVTFDGSVPTAQQVDTVIVNDDDGRIQFNGQNGQPNNETGAAAQIVLGEGRLVQSFNTGNAGAGDTQMVLVEVTYQSANGTGTFEALRLTQPIFSGSLVYYMPAHRIGRSG